MVEELSRYIFIWQIWLGASTALKYNEHIQCYADLFLYEK